MRTHTHIITHTLLETGLHNIEAAILAGRQSERDIHRGGTHTHIHRMGIQAREAYTHTHWHNNTYMHTYIHTYIHTCAHAHTYIQATTHSYRGRYIHTCKHTCIHT